MTIKTFWTIFLKIFGLYLIWQTLIYLPSLFSSILLEVRVKIISFLPLVIIIAFMIGLFTLIFWCCLFKTGWLIKKLKLDDGFNGDSIELNVHRSDLLKIAVIVLGGLMVADGLPILLYDIFKSFQRSSSGFAENLLSPSIVSNLLKVLIGYFMVADSRLIVNFIERKRKKATTEPEPGGKEEHELEE